MAVDRKIKWILFIFNTLYCMSSGCEYHREDCYFDLVCSSEDETLPDFDYRLYDNSCHDTAVYINGYNYIPIRIQFNSIYNLELFLEDQPLNRLRKIIVSLTITNIRLASTPVFRGLENLKLLNMSNNNLHVAKLFDDNQLIPLEIVDLSHNLINSIQIDNNQYVYGSIRKLNLSHNLLTDIPGGVLELLKYLEHLDLSYNHIANIDYDTFEGIKQLKYLYFSHNNVTDINASLFRFGYLEELYLDNNQIENLSGRDFEKLKSLRTLNLDFNKIHSIQKDTFNKTYLLTTLKLHNNLLNHIHKDAFLSTNSLQMVDLSNNLIKNLPKDLFVNKNLTWFSIAGNSLEGAISKGNFVGLQLITELDLSYQAITALEEFAFFNLTKLTRLLVNNNKIETISYHSFITLTGLKYLDLSNNLILSIEFSKLDLISLQSFYLNNNYITEILQKEFRGLSRLRFLDVSNNNISRIEPSSFKTIETIESIQLYNNPINGALFYNIFDGLHSVPALDLSCTSITSLQNGSLNGMMQLQELNISRSSIHKLEYSAFMNTGNIKTIDLSFNKLTDFFVDGNDLQNLTTLYLNNNAIFQITKYVFRRMNLLTEIILSYNLIQSIDEKSFEDQSYLRYLDVSFNNNLTFHTLAINNTRALEKLFLSGIKNIGDFTNMGSVSIKKLELSYLGIHNVSLLHLNSMGHLTDLVISNNKLTEIELSALKNMSALESLDLSFNNISFIQPGVFKDNVYLHYLNLSHNFLTSLKYGIFRGLLSLNLLDVSYNRIRNVERERFYDIPNLKMLIVDYNRIVDISNDFLGIHLDLLSIGHNPLSCKKIISLKQTSRFKVNAVNIDENNGDNIDGIACNLNSHNENATKFNSTMNDKILIDIRDILLNLSENRGSKMLPDNYNNDLILSLSNKLDKNGVDITGQIKDIKSEVVQLKNIKSEVAGEVNRTNLLLERIMKVILGFGSSENRLIGDVNNAILNKDNVTKTTDVQNNSFLGNPSKLDALVSDVNQVKQELSYMEDVISEIDRKISLGRTLYTSSILEKLNTSDHENITNVNDSKSFIFLEVCVALILLMLLSFFLYKFYESKILIRTGSLSTRHITDALDNSNL